MIKIMKQEMSEIEKAQLLIEQEKMERAKQFSIELEELCKKYNCTLSVGQILIQAN